MTTTTDNDLEGTWDDSPAAAPLPRRRRRWLTPASAALLAIALGFAGFYAGVREEKAQGAGTASTPSASRTSSARTSSAGAGTGAASASASASASGITAGTVTRVDGSTVYVREASGATVQVKLLASTAIKKTQDVSSHTVRPGDTVVVQGTQGSGGTIKSGSISDSGNNSTATTTTSQTAATSSTG